SALVETANNWLAKNAEWEVVNCETVLFFFKQHERTGEWHLAPDLTCFPLDGETHSSLMALRWLLKNIFNIFCAIIINNLNNLKFNLIHKNKKKKQTNKGFG